MTARRKLIIIGNGFDLHHLNGIKPDTSYHSFAIFLKKNKPDLFESLCQCLPFSNDTGDKIWGEFESVLGEFDPEHIFENYRDYLDDSNPSKSGAASWAAETDIKKLTVDLKSSLNQFISKEIEFPPLDDSLKLSLNPSDADLYLNFNYTDTLERYYGIHQSQICYIHGRAGLNAGLQIGHAVEPNSAPSARPSQETLPKDMTDEQHEHWVEHMNDQHSGSAVLLYDKIDEYWAASFKNAKANIDKKINFFNQLHNIDCITILGHSLSDVDLPYIEKIKERALPHTFWRVSYYCEDEREKHRIALQGLGVLPEFVVQASIFTILTQT